MKTPPLHVDWRWLGGWPLLLTCLYVALAYATYRDAVRQMPDAPDAMCWTGAALWPLVWTVFVWILATSYLRLARARWRLWRARREHARIARRNVAARRRIERLLDELS